MSLYVQESFVNATKGYRFGDSDVYESYANTTGELYRAMLKEYGRCMGKVYVDSPEGPPMHVGWVFQGKQQYEDCKDTYLREVWVTVHDAPDTVTRTSHYHAIG